MKIKKIIIVSLVIIAVVTMVVTRLISNKQSFDRELKMVSESNGSIPVIVDTVRVQPIVTDFSMSGTFSALQEIALTAEVEGKIISVNAKEGQHVDSGTLLALIDTTIYSSQLQLARYNLKKANKDYQRDGQLLKTDGVTMQQYEATKQTLIDAEAALASARNRYNSSFVKAPFAGAITKRYVENGTFLSPGTGIFDMVGTHKLKLIVKLTAGEVSKIKEGQQARVTVDAYPEVRLTGVIFSINVEADASKRYDAEISIDNPVGKQIRPGMFGTAQFKESVSKHGLIIPRRAIAGSIKNAEVFLVKGDSVTIRKIVVMPVNGKEVLATKGLKTGDVIVTSGQINLVDGSKIKVL